MRAQPSPTRPLTVAHRAGNSAALLASAVSLGVDLVEADVWPYRGRLEVRHLKTMGPVPLLWDKWRLVSARTPRLHLHELLAFVEPGAEIMVDLKGRDPGSVASVVSTLRAELGGHRYTVCSRSWPLLDGFRDEPQARRVHSIGTQRELRSAWVRLAERPGEGVSVHRRLLTRDVVRRLRDLSPLVMTWPVNSRATLDHVLDLGVNGVISDDLDLLARVVADRSEAE